MDNITVNTTGIKNLARAIKILHISQGKPEINIFCDTTDALDYRVRLAQTLASVAPQLDAKIYASPLKSSSKVIEAKFYVN